MKISRSSSASDFLQRCERWLLQSEARNNLMLGIARRFCGELASSDSGNYWATAFDDGELVGAAFRTPPYPLAVSDMPSEVLYTDIANPTSNSIYAKSGYRPVREDMMLVFETAPVDPATSAPPCQGTRGTL